MAPHTGESDPGRRAQVTETLLWSVDETARQLGGISPRLVKRLLAEGKLTPVRIGRRRLIDPSSARALVANNAFGDNPPGVAVLEQSTCQYDRQGGNKAGSSSGRTRRTGGHLSRQQAADDLGAVLALPLRMTRTD
jgi:hypothetical protein